MIRLKHRRFLLLIILTMVLGGCADDSLQANNDVGVDQGEPERPATLGETCTVELGCIEGMFCDTQREPAGCVGLNACANDDDAYDYLLAEPELFVQTFSFASNCGALSGEETEEGAIASCTASRLGREEEISVPCASCPTALLLCALDQCFNECLSGLEAPSCVSCRDEMGCNEGFDSCVGDLSEWDKPHLGEACDPDEGCFRGSNCDGTIEQPICVVSGACTNDEDVLRYLEIRDNELSELAATCALEACRLPTYDENLWRFTSPPLPPTPTECTHDCLRYREDLGLSSGCLSCTARETSCTYYSCAEAGCADDPNSEECLACREDRQCDQKLDRCVGDLGPWD